MSYDVQTRISRSTARIDNLLADIERREREREAREDAARMRADAAQARADAERTREIQVRYDSAFRAFGVQTPPAVEGERPGQYRQRLYEGLRRKLPSNHELFSTRADDIPASAAKNFERMVIEAAMAEATKPSLENLPASGELLRRDTVDPMTGARSIGWHGRESFIKSLGRPGGRVLRIINRKDNSVIWGQPFSRAG
jgi:hypothetical protein